MRQQIDEMSRASVRSYAHLRRDFEQRQQHEITLMHARMRNGQRIRVNHDVTIQQHVDVQRTRRVSFTRSRSAMRAFDRRCMLMYCLLYTSRCV